MQNGYSICYNEWALNKNIKDELGLLLIISSLTASEGYCYASNDYFADLFNISEVTVSRKIKKLEKENCISITYKRRGCEITRREIRLVIPGGYQTCKSSINKNDNRTINKNVKENNINSNNINFNNNSADTPVKNTIIPLIEREPKNDIEKVEKQYLLNYQELYKTKRVFFEKPVNNWNVSRKLTKQSIEKYGLQTIINAVNKAKDNDFCVSGGYPLTTILSAGVLSRLINGTEKKRGSMVNQLGVDTVTDDDLKNINF